MNRLKALCKRDIGATFLKTLALVATLAGCGTAARSEKMIPALFQTSNPHPRTVRVNVTGGQERITNEAFKEAVTNSIIRSRTFARVLDDPNAVGDFLLTIDLSSKDMRLAADSSKLETVWTLQRGGNGPIVWREAIVSESTGSFLREATENAARNNIEQALTKISKLNLRLTEYY